MADKMTVKQALKAIQTEVNYHAGSDTHYRAERLEQSLATLRAEIKRLEKDAGRWRHARTILSIEDIERAQKDMEDYELSPQESENVKADAAIDAAIDQARGKGVLND